MFAYNFLRVPIDSLQACCIFLDSCCYFPEGCYEGTINTIGKLGTSKLQVPCLQCLLRSETRDSLSKCTLAIYARNARMLHHCDLSFAVNCLSTACVGS